MSLWSLEPLLMLLQDNMQGPQSTDSLESRSLSDDPKSPLNHRSPRMPLQPGLQSTRKLLTEITLRLLQTLKESAFLWPYSILCVQSVVLKWRLIARSSFFVLASAMRWKA